ncbi:MAG TPA: Na/Pi symporter [Phycisphaerales bacterium]|nr:Na/Pi symporter [Phycisphaerales bacterium]HMP37659.1 Na/Pi symporter [Phycisphaerales bacterium]
MAPPSWLRSGSGAAPTRRVARYAHALGAAALATIVAILGGLGLFLLGMSVMTDGLRGLAGSALRAVLARAAATPIRGTLWGAIVTMMVQSSSATTMTTIGLVSAGLLTFPQGLSLVFGANVGTTGTGWLVALLGVRFSLTAAAMPLVFAGALMKLLGRGKMSAAGSALAGFALLLAGLTALQQGMSGLAERLNPADLPAVIGAEGTGWIAGAGGVLLLVGVGILLTAVMQSSSAAIAVTLSALHAGAIGTDQAVALVIGENIGTTVSALIASIGTNTSAKRTAVAYVLFKLVTAVVALVSFPVVVPLLLRASTNIDPVTLLAIYHTGFNLTGVALLLPLIGPFAAFVERLVPQRGSMLVRHLDRSVTDLPEIAIESARRTVAGALRVVATESSAVLDRVVEAHERSIVVDPRWLEEPASAIVETRRFLGGVAEPPSSAQEQARMAGTLHALDHVGRLIEALGDDDPVQIVPGDEQLAEAVALCLSTMRGAAQLAALVAEPGLPPIAGLPVPDAAAAQRADPSAPRGPEVETAVPDVGAADRAPDDEGRGLLRLESPETDGERSQSEPRDVIATDFVRSIEASATALAALRRTHRVATLAAAGARRLPAGEAIARVEAMRRLDRYAYHAWRAAAHLAGASEPV